ncbi:MAG: nucleoside phosphorylase [Gammaproteobacteria bacterium]|nr:nucleoside phosphorylase [Gammaproteobacteria bacterium]
MFKKHFKAEHLNATEDDLQGNEEIGRYILLPGSDGRAQEIADHFENVTVKSHSRGHNLYLGTLSCVGHPIDVAVVSTGMGCPSTEIILHELFHLGAKRFLRIGSAGSLQPNLVKVGDLINAQASVRDGSTACHYAPIEFPAIASLELTSSILLAAAKLGLSDQLHTGILHCKSSLYSREFGANPLSNDNKAYIDLLIRAGVLASEMETATLFVQSQIYNHQLKSRNGSPQQCVLSGAILDVVGDLQHYDQSKKMPTSIELAIETIKTLATQELVG